MRRTVIDVGGGAVAMRFLAPDVARRPRARSAFAVGASAATAAVVGGFFGAQAAVAACVGHAVTCGVLGSTRSYGARFAGLASGAALAAALAADALPAAALGALFGAAAWCLAFWEQMIFLDQERPLAYLRHQIDEALNVFVKNDRKRWDRMYIEGQWEFLRSPELAPLYAAVADFLIRTVSRGAAVVDLGCGNGALLAFLRDWHRGYLGIDISGKAIERFHRAGLEPGEQVRTQAIEEFDDYEGFEVAVFNEVLYYLPVEEAVRAVRRAFDGLRGCAAVLVVMTRNPKTDAIWDALERWRASERRTEFRCIASEPPCDIRIYLRT